MEIIESPEHMRKRFLDLARQYFGPNVYETRHPERTNLHKLMFAEYIKGGFFKEAIDRQILTLMTDNGALFGMGGVFKDMDIYVFFEEHFQTAVQFAQACEQITQKRVRLIKHWEQ